MKQFPSIIMACALAIPALAQDATTNSVPAGGKIVTNSDGSTTVVLTGWTNIKGTITFPASAAVLTPPLVLTNDYLYLASAQAELADGGKAVFNFTVTNSGNYVIETLVNAPDESSNSFFVNIDAQPADPDMIWDIPVTTGFEKRVISWRGSGDSGNDEFTPKRFKINAGAHTLVIVGREPGTLLKSLSIYPAPPE